MFESGGVYAGQVYANDNINYDPDIVIPAAIAPGALLPDGIAEPLLPDTIWNTRPQSKYDTVVVSLLLSVKLIVDEPEYKVRFKLPGNNDCLNLDLSIVIV